MSPIDRHLENLPRRDYRFPAGIPVELHAGSYSYPGSAENLSRTGVLMVGPVSAAQNERVDLTLSPPGGGRSFKIPGHVARVEAGKAPGTQRIGLEFDPLSAAEAADLEGLLSRVIEGHGPAALQGVRPGTPPREVKKVLDAIPLAHRVSLAARAGIREREILRQDSSPAVLDALTRNPNLVVAEARFLASSIALLPGTMRSLAADQRFLGDEEFCMILAANPRTPLDAAERLTAHFKPHQIRKLLGRSGVSGRLREKLLKRGPRTS